MSDFWEKTLSIKQFFYFPPPPAQLFIGDNLHGTASLSAFKHEDEVAKVSHRCLPRNEFSLISEETGGIQSQSHVDIFGPERHRNCTVVFVSTRVRQQHMCPADSNGYLAKLKASSISCPLFMSGIS